MKTDPNIYVVADYSATGEGRSVSILITRALPQSSLEDYETEPRFTEDGFDPGVEANTAEFRAMREFREEFGGFYAMGAETLDRNEFFHCYGKHVPDYLYQITDPDSKHTPASLYYKSQIHLNFS